MNPQAEIRSVTGVPAPATDGPTTTLDKIVARNGNAVEIPLLEGSTADITTINSTDVNADNIIANNIINTSGATASGSRRQTVLSGRKASVHADFIEGSTGLSVVAKASPSEPIVTTIASGWDAYGKPVNYNNAITSDITFSGLTSSATNFLGLKKNGNVLDQVVTLLPPVYGNIFSSDRENKINASFNGTHGDTEFVDEYGNLFRAYGTGWQISNVNQYSGMNTARCNSIATGNHWECTPANLDNRSLDQWTVEFFFRQDSFAILQTLFCALTNFGVNSGIAVGVNTSGIPLFYLSNNESTYSIWNLTPPVLTTDVPATKTGLGPLTSSFAMTATNWYHFAWVFDGLAHKLYLNGYLVVAVNISDFNQFSQVFAHLKPSKFNKIIVGADTNSPQGTQLIGNISNFAFHPYAKYQTKKFPFASMTSASRDIFTPPSVPLSLTTQSDRYYEQSEAIYLDFEAAADGDVFTKDKYGRLLVAGGNGSATLTAGGYIESGAAKFGTKSLYFSGAATNVNGAYIKAPVWADKWTVEFWAMDNLLTGALKSHFNIVAPPVAASLGFRILSDGNGTHIRFTFYLGTTEAANDIVSFSTSYAYSSAVYNHIAVSYDGVTYMCFVNGSLVTSSVSQLKVVDPAYYIFGRSAGNTEHLNGKIDDFSYVPYCKYTAVFTPPVAALGASMPEQYVFDTKKMQMYKGHPTAFVAENTVFIGEALTSVLNVEKAITYALNGEYRERVSSDFIPQFNFKAFRSHNIGINIASGKIRGILLSQNNPAGGAKEEIRDVTASYYDGGVLYIPIPPFGIVNRNLLSINFGNSPTGPDLTVAGNGSLTFFYASSSHLIDILLTAERSF